MSYAITVGVTLLLGGLIDEKEQCGGPCIMLGVGTLIVTALLWVGKTYL